jgi:hypothetical protein
VFAEAVSLAENVGVLAVNPADGLPNMSFVGNPADVLTVSTAKSGTEMNTPLLGPDAPQATARTVLGIPLRSSPAVTAGAMWLVPRDKPFVVIRQQAEVRADSSAYFSSDRTKCPIGPRWADGKYHNCAANQVRTETSRPATSPPNALWHSCSQVPMSAPRDQIPSYLMPVS